MFQLLQTVFAFILTLGILVTVHEFGHYWVAKRLGVKILRFSVGFGRPLVCWVRGADKTEFVIAAIPLGGYVKMLDEGEGEVASEEQHRAFNRQSLAVRAAIVVAGPLVNFIFAIFAFAVMFVWGIDGVRPVIGDVSLNTPAAHAGLQSGDQILKVNETHTARWESVIHETLSAVLNDSVAVFSVEDKQGNSHQRRLVLNGVSADDFSQKNLFEKLGFKPFRPIVPAEIGGIMVGGAAERAGLLAGDKILQVNDKIITDWHSWGKIIQINPEKKLIVQIERAGNTRTLYLVPDAKADKGFAGVKGPHPWPPAEYTATERYNIFDASKQAVQKTWDLTVLSLQMMGKMLTLEVSPRNISGPLSIAEYAGHSFEVGFARFLFFLGLVSISLGIINLMPIPLLDGGHLLFYLIEWVKGSPLSETALSIMQRVGIALVMSLMGLALFNDFNRLLN